ncbi:MAG: alpha/beta fold hydrolase [Blastocatellia bacterium]
MMWRKSLLILAAVLYCEFGMILTSCQSTDTADGPAGELQRQAFLGVDLGSPSQAKAGVEVKRITNAEVATKTGLRAGDRILRVNGSLLDSFVTYQKIFPALRAGETVRFEIVRNDQVLALTTTLSALPREQLKGAHTIYDSVLTDFGSRLRMIVTRPQNAQGQIATGKLPVVFLVGWLSCDSVEYPFGPSDGFGQAPHDIATKSGVVLVRTDKPGVGDSEGPGCVECDFQTELAGYRAAFRALKRYDFVDPDRIFILGLSNGGGFAPLVPQNEKVRGYIIAGGWAKTWFEHMIEHERRRLQLSGKNQGEIKDLMKGYAEFYTDYLVRKMTPREVLRAKPHLATLWYDMPEHQYGRPASFYHQLQDLNLASAWEKVDAPVLILYGEYDWIMSRADHELIAEIVNSKHPGRATFVELPKTDHLFMTYDNIGAAFEGATPGRYNPSVTEQILKFLQSNR